MKKASTHYRDWTGSMSWKTLAILLVLTVTNCVQATVVCEGCRPLALQEGPGIGLSLSPGHGTAAVQFINGTTVDVAVIEATEAYVQAIKNWTHAPPLSWAQPKFIEKTLLQRLLSFPRHEEPMFPSYQVSDSLLPLVEMIRALWQKVDASIQLEHKKVFLSVPDFALTNDTFRSQISPLIEAAGLQNLRHWPLCRTSLLHLYDLEDCYEFGPECESYRGRQIGSVLSIHLDEWSLSLRSMLRSDGMFYPNVGMTKLIWREAGTQLKHEIEQFITTDFDLLSLSGPEAPQLYDIIKQLFKDNAKIVPEDYVRSAQEHTFATARGAARVARQGMCNDWEICLANSWCPISDHCTEDFAGLVESIEKSEL